MSSAITFTLGDRDAWSQLGDLAKEEAMAQYTSLLSHVAPEWDERQEEGRQPRAKGGMGPVFSSLAAGAEAAGAEEAMVSSPPGCACGSQCDPCSDTTYLHPHFQYVAEYNARVVHSLVRLT